MPCSRINSAKSVSYKCSLVKPYLVKPDRFSRRWSRRSLGTRVTLRSKGADSWNNDPVNNPETGTALVRTVYHNGARSSEIEFTNGARDVDNDGMGA